MALVEFDSQPAVNHHAHDSLVILTVDLTSLCNTQSTRRYQLRPFDSVKFLKPEESATLWLPHPPPFTPIEVLLVLTKP